MSNRVEVLKRKGAGAPQDVKCPLAERVRVDAVSLLDILGMAIPAAMILGGGWFGNGELAGAGGFTGLILILSKARARFFPHKIL